MIRIKLNRAILMPRFSHFLGNRTINFRTLECLVTCFLRVTVSLLCRLQAVSKIHVPIYPCLTISEGRQKLFDPLIGTATYPRLSGNMLQNMRKLMWVFLGKFENRGIKIAGVNSIHITKSINLH